MCDLSDDLKLWKKVDFRDCKSVSINLPIIMESEFGKQELTSAYLHKTFPRHRNLPLVGSLYHKVSDAIVSFKGGTSIFSITQIQFAYSVVFLSIECTGTIF